MFEDLAAAIERLEVAVDGDSLVRALALRDQLDARIAEAAGAFGTYGTFEVTDLNGWVRCTSPPGAEFPW